VEAQHTNFIAVSVPQRFDLNKRLSITEEIRKYNRMFHKGIKRLKNVQLTEAVSDRELFTQHGLHLYRKEEEVMTR
jgi:hypothetical protein